MSLQYLAIFQCQFTIHCPKYSTVLLPVAVAVSNQMLLVLAARGYFLRLNIFHCVGTWYTAVLYIQCTRWYLAAMLYWTTVDTVHYSAIFYCSAMHCYWQLLPVAERSPSELRLGNRVTHTYHANYPPKCTTISSWSSSWWSWWSSLWWLWWSSLLSTVSLQSCGDHYHGDFDDHHMIHCDDHHDYQPLTIDHSRSLYYLFLRKRNLTVKRNWQCGSVAEVAQNGHNIINAMYSQNNVPRRPW